MSDRADCYIRLQKGGLQRRCVDHRGLNELTQCQCDIGGNSNATVLFSSVSAEIACRE